LDESDLLKLRVLLLGGKTPGMATLRSVLNIAGVTNIVSATSSRDGLDLLSTEHFDAVFCEHCAEVVNGRSFPAAARGCASILNPMIPIFELQDRASRRRVERARDNGVTDVLTCPISPKTITDKLRAALITPRPFIACSDFFGPERRAPRTGFGGQDRRVRKPKKMRVNLKGEPLSG
jgi:PleD family two-component response regulator